MPSPFRKVYNATIDWLLSYHVSTPYILIHSSLTKSTSTERFPFSSLIKLSSSTIFQHNELWFPKEDPISYAMSIY